MPFSESTHEAVTIVSVSYDCELLMKVKGPNGNMYLSATLADTLFTSPLVAQLWLEKNIVGKVVIVERLNGLVDPENPEYGVSRINLFCEGMHINQEVMNRGWARYMPTLRVWSV